MLHCNWDASGYLEAGARSVLARYMDDLWVLVGGRVEVREIVH